LSGLPGFGILSSLLRRIEKGAGMAYSGDRCLGHSEIEAFLNSEFTEEEEGNVRRHVEDCTDCEEAISREVTGASQLGSVTLSQASETLGRW
jgi:hypothetical protein